MSETTQILTLPLQQQEKFNEYIIHRKKSMLKILVLTFIALFASTNSLAKITQEEVYIQRGYPYEGLVVHSEAVKIFYTELADNITCRVEVTQDGHIWRGEEHNTSLKKFTQKPLSACMDRVDAKKLLANTF